MIITDGSRKVITNQVTYKHIYKDRGFVIVGKEGEKDVN